MFDIGFSELVVIAVIALIVLGPERLPEAARALGSWVAKARRFMRTMSEELERETDFKGFRDLKDEFDNSRRKFEDDWERSGRTGTEDNESETAASEAEDGSADDAGSADDHGEADTGTVTNGSGAKRADDVAAAATDGETVATEPKPKPKPRSKATRTRKPASSTAKPKPRPKTTRSKPKSAKPSTTKPKAAKAKPKQTRKSAAGRTNPAPDQPDTHETVARERERNA